MAFKDTEQSTDAASRTDDIRRTFNKALVNNSNFWKVPFSIFAVLALNSGRYCLAADLTVD